MYKLYLDDFRVCPYTDWVTVRNYTQFCHYIEEHGLPDIVSFDHDLDNVHYGFLDGSIPYDEFKIPTGYHAAQWLLAYCEKHNLSLPEWRVHSLNPQGRENITNLLSRVSAIPLARTVII